MSYLNQLEPDGLVQAFLHHPPEGFELLPLADAAGTPAFIASFDLFTTADDALKQRARSFPLYALWSRWLRIRTAFAGTTVSEYVLLPQAGRADALPAAARFLAKRCRLCIIKDIPQDSPLLPGTANSHADALVAACKTQGFVMVEGQALAYVPIDFTSIDAYLAGLSTGRRKNLKRKLRSRDSLRIERVATGAAFDDDERVDRYFALYEAVYAQSETHFDKLTRAFLAEVLRGGVHGSNGGVVFEYRRATDNLLLGWNLCFEHDGKLIDKTIGLAYPQAREANLYFVSWIVNLEYALERGLSHYVAGWTDPQVKAQLGASFTFTRHAVYVRNPVLRWLARRFSSHFESDRNVLRSAA